MNKRTEEQISNNMRQIRNKDSKIELLLRHELWKRGLRYRKNVKNIMGKPDIAFVGKKIAIFVDSEFWHGYNFNMHKKDFHSHEDFWINKIQRNIERDLEVTIQLRDSGWMVFRFWGNDIKKNLKSCADEIERAYKERL